ncbi:hypothetical protein H8B09_01930 [Paenibacillus sp. PR3]|uniref:PepSY domain-containing protein n=1 Tax=Paenibacillus terricola TaxID=2763503 RepID=A0ABR8MN98_9BACL|nr:hypothetical protein [Paenibacillus terricola]MBD3917498.1 hypothetical protein [Paenibacillus terricola]
MTIAYHYRFLSLFTAMLLSFILPNETATAQRAVGQAVSPAKERFKGSIIRMNEATGTPSLMTGTLSKPSKHSPGWIAYEFVIAHKKLYGLRNPKQNLVIVHATKSDAGESIVEFKHLLFGTPVWGDILTITIDSTGIVRRAEGTIHPKLEKRLFHRAHHAAVSPQQALSIAMKQELPVACTLQPEVQAYYNPRQPGVPLIYAVSLCDSGPHNPSYTLIHSLSGRVIAQPSK